MLSSIAFHADRPIQRSRSPQNSSQVVLTHGHVADALSCSPDHGATLILSKLNVSELDVTVIHSLLAFDEDVKDDRPPVERLAMAHNRLSSLPSDFGHLTHLRYINLKHNNFTAFPHVLTVLTSLEILDLSHNKISTLPSQPDQLINLKVLCLSRNRLTGIPSYIVQFHCLEVLQVDRNPIEWPPRFVIDAGRSNESVQAMKDWIRDLKEWIEAHPESKFHDEPSYFDLNRQESWQYPTDKSEENDNISHTRSGSVESSFSFTSIPESISGLAVARLADSEPQRPPPLQLSSLRPYGDDSSPTKSDGSCTEHELCDGPITSTNGSYDAPIQHNRNASYAGQEQYSHRTEISTKMSMPDLRSAKVDFTKKLPARSQTRLPSLDGAYSVGDSTQGQSSRSPDLSLSINTEIRNSASFTEESEDKSTPRAAYSMAFERNSYFQRLSTFPASIILPHSLLCLVETARSMLFAACQVYQTLDHYIVHVDERLSSVLRKVVEPASSDMLQLIAALDRFDASSRKALPPPAICRAVVEGCRNTAAAFNKVVRVLTLQLQVLTTFDDVRYSRLLLVELYAATAEIACAWKQMLPQIRHVKSLVHMNWSGSHHIPTLETKSVAPLDLSAFRHHIGGPGVNGISGNIYRTRTVRRHAGSFSSKDVEIGKQLPSYDNPSYRGSGSQGHLQTHRNPRRQATTPVTFPSTQNSPHLPLSPAFVNRSLSRGIELDRGHSRHGSQSSIHASSLSSSPIISGKLMTSFELPSNSRIQVDKEALHAIKEAVDIAPTVWNMIEDMLEDILSSKADFREGLNKARAVTKRLAEMVVTMQESDSPTDRKLLREDARSFLKVVVQLSSAVKTYKEAQDVPSVLRNSMVRLTNATEEFAILLHVSSFSPTTPRSFSPVVSSPLPPPHTAQQNDSQLGSSLSRSRNPQVSSNVTPDGLEGLRSALPAQPFMIPSTRRTGRKDSA